MSDSSTIILPESECWDLLRRTAVGRLAVDVAGQPDIFPINHLVDHATLVFRTAPGTKLAGAVLGRHVAYEIDGYEPEERMAWSVVVKGVASLVDRMDDVFAAEDLPLFPWVATPKPDFVRIAATSVTGRRFHVVDDVTPDASLGWHLEEPHESGRPRDELAVLPEPGLEFHPGEPVMRPD